MSGKAEITRETISIAEDTFIKCGDMQFKVIDTTICTETLQKRVTLMRVEDGKLVGEKWDLPMHVLYEKALANDPLFQIINAKFVDRFSIEPLIKVGQVYRHYKGRQFKIVAITICPITFQKRVVYMEYLKNRQTTGEKWNRPMHMFFDKVRNASSYSKEETKELFERFMLEFDI